MGLFKKLSKTFNKAVGFDPTFGIGASVEDFINDPTGAKAASKQQEAALRAAGRYAEADALKLETERKRIEAETAPFREYGRSELERLRTQKPGETEFYKQSLEGGAESIAAEANKYGLVSSGSTRNKFGNLASDLLLQEEIARQQGMDRAAGYSQIGIGANLDLLRQQGAASSLASQLNTSAATAAAQGKMANRNFWLNLGTQAGGLALGSYLAGPAGGAAGGAAGKAATSGAGAGGYQTYTSPGGYGSITGGTGYNQFLNPYN